MRFCALRSSSFAVLSCLSCAQRSRINCATERLCSEIKAKSSVFRVVVVRLQCITLHMHNGLKYFSHHAKVVLLLNFYAFLVVVVVVKMRYAYAIKKV